LGYTVVNVPAQPGALQAAIDAAGCRTELRGAPGFGYTPITLRQKPCNERIHTVILTANGLPDVAPGVRMTPLLSAQRNQTKIITTRRQRLGDHRERRRAWVLLRRCEHPRDGRASERPRHARHAADDARPGARRLRVPPCVRGRRPERGHEAVLLHQLVLDTAIVDSWSDECHSNNGDSQWLEFLNGPGPYLIANNYGEAGHEIVMFGGGDPSIPGLIPSDITIIGNHVTRPASWKGVWQVKNPD
jgi:hypothetical protein